MVAVAAAGAAAVVEVGAVVVVVDLVQMRYTRKPRSVFKADDGQVDVEGKKESLTLKMRKMIS